MNSDIYSSVLTGKKLIIIICDNGGFAVINKLQNNTGNVQLQQPDQPIARRSVEPFAVDFEAHARAMGAQAKPSHPTPLEAAAFPRQGRDPHLRDRHAGRCPYEGWTTKATPGGKSARPKSRTAPKSRAS
jgi:3D-(3,5/4)-trihydroxycyclohexane-1,2-dione acylhydrolase (decyclizing)